MRIGQLALISVLGSVAGQLSVGSLSTNCQGAAEGLLTAGIGGCTNVVSLISVLSASGSIIAPFTSFLNGFCSQTCSSSDLNPAAASIQKGCATDLQSNNPAAEVLSLFIGNYTQVKNVFCLQSTSASPATFCLSNLLTSIQNSTGAPVTVNTITGLFSDLSTLNSVPAASLCTDCFHGLVTETQVLIPSTSSSNASTVYSGISTKCGSSFLDKSLPSTVSEYGSVSTASAPAVSSKSLSAAETLKIGNGMVGAAFAVVGIALGMIML